mmetsp:Transcript_12023/g.34748  ORF Transcript_12023/g.34748 Transcript_12023/m.34748 type:complete len:330 (-) Transcript_12023:3618-4607(-)
MQIISAMANVKDLSVDLAIPSRLDPSSDGLEIPVQASVTKVRIQFRGGVVFVNLDVGRHGLNELGRPMITKQSALDFIFIVDGGNVLGHALIFRSSVELGWHVPRQLGNEIVLLWRPGQQQRSRADGSRGCLVAVSLQHVHQTPADASLACLILDVDSEAFALLAVVREQRRLRLGPILLRHLLLQDAVVGEEHGLVGTVELIEDWDGLVDSELAARLTCLVRVDQIHLVHSQRVIGTDVLIFLVQILPVRASRNGDEEIVGIHASFQHEIDDGPVLVGRCVIVTFDFSERVRRLDDARRLEFRRRRNQLLCVSNRLVLVAIVNVRLNV